MVHSADLNVNVNIHMRRTAQVVSISPAAGLQFRKCLSNTQWIAGLPDVSERPVLRTRGT